MKTYAECAAAAGQTLYADRAAKEEAYRRGGTWAVARETLPNGTEKEQAALAADLERLWREAAEHTPAA